MKKSGYEKIKFDKKMPRHLTIGIKNCLPVELQLCLWAIIDSKVKEGKHNIDYLQVFNIKSYYGKTLVKYSQEEPVINESYLIDFDYKSVPKKIYVIDEEAYAIMMLSEEY